MFNKTKIAALVQFVKDNADVVTKDDFATKLQNKFELKCDKPIYYCNHFAVRLAYSKGTSVSNTIIALSRLKAYDHLPFFVIVISPKGHRIVMANSTCINKISHSSAELRIDNIKGSINFSDILQKIGEINNIPENFESLFDYHSSLGFDGNLKRLVENTGNIQGTGTKFVIDDTNKVLIEASINRAEAFIKSDDYKQLKTDLDNRVKSVETSILIAAMIDNVNIRGRVIEYLITSDEGTLKNNIIKALKENTDLPADIKTENQLGDYRKEFETYNTETDIKTKILLLSSNPKGYNVDKLLQFLSEEKSVYMLYLVGINLKDDSITLRLCSMYDSRLEVRIYNHWSGRNSRGEAQFDGTSLEKIFTDEPGTIIDKEKAEAYLKKLMES